MWQSHAGGVSGQVERTAAGGRHHRAGLHSMPLLRRAAAHAAALMQECCGRMTTQNKRRARRGGVDGDRKRNGGGEGKRIRNLRKYGSRVTHHRKVFLSEALTSKRHCRTATLTAVVRSTDLLGLLKAVDLAGTRAPLPATRRSTDTQPARVRSTAAPQAARSKCSKYAPREAMWLCVLTQTQPCNQRRSWIRMHARLDGACLLAATLLAYSTCAAHADVWPQPAEQACRCSRNPLVCLRSNSKKLPTALCIAMPSLVWHRM